MKKETVSKINNLVAQKPRTVQEIAQFIGKNWRTADSYVQKISEEQGTIAVRTFRGGTRGALKIVYWNLINKNQSTFQEMLFQRIINCKHKSDFSPFDIYQYVSDAGRESFIEEQEDNLNIKQDLIKTISDSEKQVLIFSGDLSWAKAKQGKEKLLKSFENLLNKNVPIKILANIDLNSVKNVKGIKELNHEFGKDLIEIRHCQQPLRAFIVDDNLVRIKEKYFLKKTAKNTYLFYSISDEDWVHWLQKIFWHFFSTAISADKRIQDLESIG
jgi:hypothetical protein